MKDPDSPRDVRRELGTAFLGACSLLSHLFSISFLRALLLQVCEDGRRGPASRSLNGDSRTALWGTGNTSLRYKTANMLKPSGLKIPGRAGKHSSPVGRASGTTAAAVTTASKEGKDVVQQGHELSQVITWLRGKGLVVPVFSRMWNSPSVHRLIVSMCNGMSKWPLSPN